MRAYSNKKHTHKQHTKRAAPSSLGPIARAHAQPPKLPSTVPTPGSSVRMVATTSSARGWRFT